MKLVQKRCAKCGNEALYRPRVRHCRHQKFGPKSYWCYGRLTTVKTVSPAKVKPVRRPQDVAQQKLDKTRAEIDRKNERLRLFAKKTAQVAKDLRKLEIRARRLSVIASMTDEEVAADSDQKRAAKDRRDAAKRTRKIVLE